MAGHFSEFAFAHSSMTSSLDSFEMNLHINLIKWGLIQTNEMCVLLALWKRTDAGTIKLIEFVTHVCSISNTASERGPMK